MFFSKGKLEALHESGHDMILKYEDATYTTFRTYCLTRIPQLDMHVSRLVNEQLSKEDVVDRIREAMTAYLGCYTEEFRVYCFSKLGELDFFAELLPTPPKSARFGCCYAVRTNPTIKSVEWAHERCALEQIKSSQGFNEIIIHDTHVKEGLSSNVYMVISDKIVTTPLQYVLSGSTREMLLNFCKCNGIEVEERLFTEDEMRAADSVFVTSTSRGVLPAESICYENSTTVAYQFATSFIEELRNGLEQQMVEDATDILGVRK